MHQTVKIIPTKNNGLQNQPIIAVNIKKIAINGIPAGCIGVKIEALIESTIFIFFPIEITSKKLFNLYIASMTQNAIIQK